MDKIKKLLNILSTKKKGSREYHKYIKIIKKNMKKKHFKTTHEAHEYSSILSNTLKNKLLDKVEIKKCAFKNINSKNINSLLKESNLNKPNKHIGSDFNTFLKENKLNLSLTRIAIKRIVFNILYNK